MAGSKGDLMLPIAVNQWQTIQSRDWKGPQGRAYKGTAKDLPAQTEKGFGKLNPRWVETLMGLPIGWVMPSCARPWTIELMSLGSSEMVLTPMLPRKPLEPFTTV